MPTLERPGVEITQVISSTSPTILTPTLVPCVVGPCYQIVEPLDSTGQLDATAKVTTKAMLRSASDVTNPAAVGGETMVIEVTGTAYSFTFPTDPSSSSLSHAVIVSSFNAAVTGASAAFVNDRMIITADAAGSGATLKLTTNPDNGNDPLKLTDDLNSVVAGKDSYDSTTQVIDYESLPSPKAPVTEIVLEGDNISMYRYLSPNLTAFGETSAPHWNSYTQGASTWANQPTTTVQQGAYGAQRTTLHTGHPGTGKSNKISSYGSEAIVRIPLTHATGVTAGANGGGMLWPDVTGLAYLEVEAAGFQNYRLSDTGTIGNYPGADGNTIQVVFDIAGAVPVTVAWAAPVLTISRQSDTDNVATNPTFADLRTALAAFTDAANSVNITLVFPEERAGHEFLGNRASALGWGTPNPGERTYYLSGGTDPVNFTADAAGNAQKAWMTGAVSVSTATASTLGLADEVLSVSIDGSAWRDITLTGGTAVATTINTALVVGSLGTCGNETVYNAFGESVSALKIGSSGTGAHDSTIQIKSNNNKVIETLFSGYASRTDTISAIATATNKNRTVTLATVTNYNKRAATLLEKALVPGATTVHVTDAKLNALYLSLPTLDAGIVGAPYVLTVAHSAVNGGANVVITTANLVAATVTDLVDKLDAQLTAGQTGADLEDFIIFSEIATGVLGISEVTGTGTLTLVSCVGDAGPTVDQVPVLGSNLFGVATASVAGTATVQDTGTGSALQLTALSATTQIVAAANVSFDPTSVADLTTYGLDLTSGSSITHSTGAIVLQWMGDSVNAPEANKYPMMVMFGATADIDITYSRVYACATQAAAPAYADRVFHGHSNKTLPGDAVWYNGSLKSRVTSIGTLSVTTAAAVVKTYTGASLTLVDAVFDGSTDLTEWYLVAENLAAADTRVAPEVAYSDTDKTVTLKHALVRDPAGVAITGTADVYAQYSALRQDVGAGAADPELLVFNSTTEVESSIGPISTSNPLAWALYSAFLNTTNISISALGIDAVSADAPDGTLAAYQQALDYLELKTVYALAPLTQDAEVHKLFSAHVTSMSLPANKKPRIAFVNAAIPTEKESTLVVSGTATCALFSGTKYRLTFPDGTNIVTLLNGKLDANGNALVVATGTTFLPAQGVYLDRTGDGYKYLASKVVSPTILEVETADVFAPGSGPGTAGNDDAYYVTGTTATTELDAFPAAGETCTVLVRQAAISKLTTAGKLSICETMADITGSVSGYQNRRLFYVQPEKVGMTENGTEVVVDGVYACAAIAGMVGQHNPSQPFTNLPMVGITRPVGSNDLFSETHMATAAAGGVYWLVQDTAGGSVVSRHQLSTDVSSLNNRELSVTKAVDFVEYSIRGQISRFIGRNNITNQLLEAVSLGLNGVLASLVGSVVDGGSLDSITRDSANPDTILIDVSITPYYAANKIKITIYV